MYYIIKFTETIKRILKKYHVPKKKKKINQNRSSLSRHLELMSRGGKKERRQNKFVKIISLNNFIAGQNGRTRADIIGEGEGKSCRDIFLENRDALLHYHVSAYKFPRERRDNIIFFLSPPPPSLSPSLTVTGAHPLEHVLQRWLILHINCLPAGEKWETGIQGTLFTRRTERKRGRERERAAREYD